MKSLSYVYHTYNIDYRIYYSSLYIVISTLYNKLNHNFNIFIIRHKKSIKDFQNTSDYVFVLQYYIDVHFKSLQSLFKLKKIYIFFITY